MIIAKELFQIINHNLMIKMIKIIKIWNYNKLQICLNKCNKILILNNIKKKKSFLKIKKEIRSLKDSCKNWNQKS